MIDAQTLYQRVGFSFIEPYAESEIPPEQPEQSDRMFHLTDKGRLCPTACSTSMDEL